MSGREDLQHIVQDAATVILRCPARVVVVREAPDCWRAAARCGDAECSVHRDTTRTRALAPLLLELLRERPVLEVSQSGVSPRP